MKIAAIDLGTNTFHLLISEATEQSYRALTSKRVYVKLRDGGLQTRSITPAAQQRALEAMRIFKKLMDEYEVKHVRAVATSAMRNANNAATLLQTIQDQTGIAVEVISGTQEAAFTYRGVKEAVQFNQDIALIMDIGGGSVEFILCNAQKALWDQSFDIGAQRLLDTFHRHDPILPQELRRLEQYLEEKLSPLFEAIAPYQPNRLIGTSGAFETLLAMYKAKEQLPVHGQAPAQDLPLHHFEQLYQDIRYKSYQERLQVPGLFNKRVDMIVVSSTLIRFVLSKTNIPRITVSTYAIKEGLFFTTLEAAHQ